MSSAAEIVFEHVTKRYAGRDGAALSDLSFTIPAGTFCVLVGPSGGGKTTALKVVNRLIPFDEGDMRIDGRSIRDLPVVELRRGIGYVIQQVGLFPHMTIGENIGTVPRLLGWPKERIRARSAELLELVGLEPGDAERYPAQLSGGQRQRVGLARALAADPPVLLMDEPFGALDPITRARLQDELRRLHHEVAKTVIFVTHDIDEAIKMGDRIAILREGGVLAQYDTPDEILAHPADEFVAQFIGDDRALRRLALRRLSDLELEPVPADRPTLELSSSTTVRNAISVLLEGDGDRLVVVDDGGKDLGMLDARAGGRPARMTPLAAAAAAGPVASGPVNIPDFGSASSCVTSNKPFCWDWVKSHWGSTLQPALVEHIELTAIAVSVGFVLALGLALFAHRRRQAEQPISILAALVYTFPSIALFQLLIPFTGYSNATLLIPLIAYTLVILFPNFTAGLDSAPPEVLEAARGMGLTRRQLLTRVELPLALPSMIGGLRIAVVSTIAIATIAATISEKGLGFPIFYAIAAADAVQDRDLLGGLPGGGARARLRRRTRPPRPSGDALDAGRNLMTTGLLADAANAHTFVEALRFIVDNPQLLADEGAGSRSSSPAPPSESRS